MNIYFAGAIRGGRDDRPWYQEIITYLKQYGIVLTEHIGDVAVGLDGQKGMTSEEIYNKDMQWLRSADVCVAEISTPSLGVGYELREAEELRLPTLILWNKGLSNLSAMIGGGPYLSTHVVEYDKREIAVIKDRIDDFMKKHALKTGMDVSIPVA